jgi:hypothetical protein
MGKTKFIYPEICSSALINYSLLSEMGVSGLVQTLYKVILNPTTLFSDWRKYHIITNESCIRCNIALFLARVICIFMFKIWDCLFIFSKTIKKIWVNLWEWCFGS